MPASDPRVGVHVRRATVDETLALTRKADAAGISTAWLTLGGPAFDSLTYIAAAITQTSTIQFGTSIVPAFIQHPVKLANQIRAIEELAAGRLRMGIGTSHGPSMGTLGIPVDHPLDRLREYLEVLVPLLRDGTVDFSGEYYRVKLVAPGPLSTPILISALREHAWQLAGELSDGGISWVTPLNYLVDQMKPAMVAAAEAAGRSAPPMVAHVPVAVGASREEARQRGREQLAVYARLPFYRAMFRDAGYAFAEGDTTYPGELLDELIVSGSDDEVVAGLRRWLDRGVDELLVAPLTGPSGDADDEHVLEVISRV